jgi:hypothetical protein
VVHGTFKDKEGTDAGTVFCESLLQHCFVGIIDHSFGLRRRQYQFRRFFRKYGRSGDHHDIQRDRAAQLQQSAGHNARDGECNPAGFG